MTMIPPHQTPSADLLERIRRYIAAHLQDSSDIIEEAKRKLPRPVPHPFEGEGERERHGLARDPGVHEEPLVCGVTLPRPRVGLDGILSRLKSKLEKPKETFSERLLRLIRERGMTDAEAYKRAGIDRKYFSKIRNGQAPSAKVIYAFIFALRLNIDEARDLLASAGYSISPARAYDLVMEFCILEGCDIDTVNGILYEMGMDVL
ncbi:MAG: helix-turn-helix domain-containing protein [Selenomonas massiliensis]